VGAGGEAPGAGHPAGGGPGAQSAQHHDLRSLASARYQAAELRRQAGDGQGALSLHQQALELYRRTGEGVHEGTTLGLLSNLALDLGDLAGAAAYAEQSLRTAEGLASHNRLALA
jgi:tetratricopeptide (TPR) repeat protein